MNRVVIVVIMLMAFCMSAHAATIKDFEREGFLHSDFVMFGKTDADLSPIYDYLSLLKENGIYLKLPDLSVTKKEDRDYIYTEIGKTMNLSYSYWLDGTADNLMMEVPIEYKPKDEALTLMIMSMLSLDHEEAEKLYASLQYNVIDDGSSIELDNYILTYSDIRNGSTGVLMLGIYRELN